MLNWIPSLSATEVTSQLVATCCYFLNTSSIITLLHKINSWFTIVEYAILLSNFCTIFNTKFILISLPIAFAIFISFFNPSSSLTSSFKPFTYNKWLISPQFYALDIHSQLCSARVLMQQVLYRRVMAKEIPPVTFLIISVWVVTALLSALF